MISQYYYHYHCSILIATQHQTTSTNPKQQQNALLQTELSLKYKHLNIINQLIKKMYLFINFIKKRMNLSDNKI